MYHTSINPYDIVNYLNELLELDSELIHDLCFNRRKCNKEIAEHKTIQIRANSVKKEEYSVGLLGILNGLIGSDKEGWGCISADCDSNKESPYKYKIKKFKILEDRLKGDNNG